MTPMRSMRISSSLLTISLLLCSGGCGPLHMPMPVRLQPDDQTKIDDAWNKALAPIDRLSNQALLDTLLSTQGYQIGVDKLSFRSEKSCAAGLVVMEIRYDRLVPAGDLFTVTLASAEGVVLREENYLRDDVESTYHALFIEKYHLEQQLENGSKLLAEQRERLSELQAREDVALSLFPKFEDDATE